MFVECSTKFAIDTCCVGNRHDNTSFGKRLPRGFGGTSRIECELLQNLVAGTNFSPCD